MNVTVEDAGTCRKKLTIEWPVERVQADYELALKQYAKVARIAGFRPGKAPAKVVERRYAKDIIKDVRDQLVPEGYQQAIKDKALTVVQVMDLDEPIVELGQPMRFAVTVEVAPDFDLPNYKGIALERKTEAVDESKVDETITNIAEQFASFDEVTEGPVQRGDLVQVDYEGTCEGQAIEDMGEETKGLGKREDFWMQADDNAFIPEFADGVVGAEIGEKRQIQVDFPADFAAKPLAGKKAAYFVDVKGMRRKRLPELDEEFYKRLGVADDAELRTRIREDLERAASQRETERLRNAIVDHLIKDWSVDLPPTAVSRETSQIVQDVIRENTRRGAAQEMLMEKKDEIMDMASRNAENRVKAQLVLDRIADTEDVTVSAKALDEHIQRLAAGYGMKPDQLRAELKKRDTVDTVEEELRRSMTIDWLMEQAVISDP